MPVAWAWETMELHCFPRPLDGGADGSQEELHQAALERSPITSVIGPISAARRAADAVLAATRARRRRRCGGLRGSDVDEAAFAMHDLVEGVGDHAVVAIAAVDVVLPAVGRVDRG
jgi:hypothetical protein